MAYEQDDPIIIIIIIITIIMMIMSIFYYIYLRTSGSYFWLKIYRETLRACVAGNYTLH